MTVPAGSLRFYVCAVAFLSGTAAVQFFPDLPPLWALLLPQLALLFLRVRFCYPVLVFLIGCAYAVFRAELQLEQTLSRELEGKDVEITARITSLIQRAERYLKFTVYVESSASPVARNRVPNRIQLRWYEARELPKVGQLWSFRVRLKRPRGFQNPGGFDYERWLFRQGIRATGYVRHGGQLHDADRTRWWDQLRERVSEHIDQGGFTHQGLLKALSVGDRGGVESSQWAVLRQTGTSHLLAISGLHIGIVAGFCFYLCSLLARPLSAFWTWLPAPRVAAIPAMGGAVGYAALAGWSIPTQRAAVMVIVFMLALALNRQSLLHRSLALALLAVLIVDPMATMDAGFWLSFGAVFSILLAFKASRRLSSRLARMVAIQLVLSTIMAPATLLFFGQASISAPLANLLAIPLVGFIVVPLVLIGCLGLATGWAWVFDLSYEWADRTLGIVWPILSLLSDPWWASWAGTVGPLTLIPLLAIVVLIWLPKVACRPGLFMFFGLWFALSSFIARDHRLEPGEYEVTVLDVGQGLSVVVRTRSRSVLYDTGAKFSKTFDAGAAVVLPFLESQRIDVIDALIVSHGDNDHIGGLHSILGGVRVKRRLTSVPNLVPEGVPCVAGDSWNWDGVVFSILSPNDPSPVAHNNASCVLRIEGRFGVSLLTGDIEKETEEELVRTRTDLKSDILLIPHQGSRTSSTPAFIEAVDPSIAMVSTGYLNQYGHPARSVVASYGQRGVEPMNTAKLGAITVRVAKQGTTVQTFRSKHRRFWFGT